MIRKYIFLMALLLCTDALAVNLVIEPARTTGSISPYLVGAHTVYYNDKDEAYSDGRFATWCKEAGVSTMRYPGGSVVKYWDWENPTGVARGDPWQPSWDGVVVASTNWMSLDEYLDFCDISEIKPLVGVNYRSGKLYGRTQDSIDRAARCVQYVVDHGYPGAFYYIGNEDMNEVGGLFASANLFVRHAEAMKAVDPDIKIFWNDNEASPTDMKRYLAIAGEWADGYEFHGKWPFGGDPSPSPPFGTYEQWKTEVPLVDRKANNNKGKSWRHKIADLRKATVEAGYPDLLLANNEYGWGKSDHYSGFNKFTSGLLMIDFLQEHFISGYDMACFWANIRSEDNGLLDKTQAYRRNPQTLGWELLADAQGGTMLKSTSSHPQVYGFTAKTDTELLAYLLNKTEESQPLEIMFLGATPSAGSAAQGIAVVDTPDHWGTTQGVPVSFDAASNIYSATLPAMSYTLVRLAIPEIDDLPALTNGILFQADFDSAPLNESATLADLDTGTQTGEWSGTLLAGKGFIRGSESNHAVLVDRYGGDGFTLNAMLASEIPVDGLAVFFKSALRRTGSDKNIYISGLDASGGKIFEVGIDSVAPPTPGYVDPTSGFIPIPEGSPGNIQFMDDTFNPDTLREISVYLNASNYWVCYESGVWVSSPLPYTESVAPLAQVRFSANVDAGLWLDDVLVVRDPDRDGDGMPDHFEIRYFGRPTNAAADVDGDFDGMNAYAEFVAGTDPLDPLSYLGVTAEFPASGILRLEWNALSGRVYSVEGTSDLLEPFVPLATNLLFPQQDYTVDFSHDTNGFYRIRVGR